MSCSRQTLLAIGVALACGGMAMADGDRPLKSSPYDPQAKSVDLFAGLQQGTITAKVVTQGAKGGHLFLTNHTQEPLTVKIPAGFVGVPVKPQFGFPNQGNFPMNQNGSNGNGTGTGNAITAATGTQMIGAGTSNSSTGTNGSALSGNNNAFPQNFFSIPAEKTLRVPYTSVCLNHGLNEPTSRTQVQLIPVEEYTDDPVLQALINKVGSGEQSQRTMQAAVWHLANGMSWQQLAEKGTSPVRVPGDNFFSASQMKAAKAMVEETRLVVSRTSGENKTTDSPRVKLVGQAR